MAWWCKEQGHKQAGCWSSLHRKFHCMHGKSNSLRPRLNRRPFTDDIFKCIFLNENEWILPRISLKFVPKVWINNISALVQIMAWRRPGDKPLSEPLMVILSTHIYITRPQWVKAEIYRNTHWLQVPILSTFNQHQILQDYWMGTLRHPLCCFIYWDLNEMAKISQNTISKCILLKRCRILT